MAKTISIIIPTYNRKELLERTLQNILSQTLCPNEIIVVDDHSTDGTIDFIKQEYGDQVICVKNAGKGPGAARNTGLAAATGNFVKFFDSDDLMTATMLEEQAKVLEKSSVGVISSPYFFARDNGGNKWEVNEDLILNYLPLKNPRPYWLYMIHQDLFITIPSMLFKREFLLKLGPWRSDVVAYEDWDFLFRIFLLEPFPLHTNKCAFLYRLHENQTTDKHFSNVQRDQDKKVVLDDIFEYYMQGDPRFSWIQKKVFLNKMYHLYRVSNGNFRGSLEHTNTVLNKIIYLGVRCSLMIGRYKSGTSWQPSIGAVRSSSIIKKYLEDIR